MSEETTRNFWEAIKNFQWPEPKPVTYRLYHDDAGRPIVYTMEDLSGTYIEVDPDTYTRASFNVKVQNGRLVVLETRVSTSRLCIVNDHGTPCDTRDVCVVVDVKQPHNLWRNQTNDQD